MSRAATCGRPIAVTARDKLLVFLTRRDVEATNNESERALRPSVIFRRVTNGFRSEWGAKVYPLLRGRHRPPRRLHRTGRHPRRSRSPRAQANRRPSNYPIEISKWARSP